MPRDSEVDGIDNETLYRSLTLCAGELISGAYGNTPNGKRYGFRLQDARDSWPVQFASFERRRRAVYCAKIWWTAEVESGARVVSFNRPSELIGRISTTPSVAANVRVREVECIIIGASQHMRRILDVCKTHAEQHISHFARKSRRRKDERSPLLSPQKESPLC